MADLVIDEWLWADLRGDNTEIAQREAYQFLEAVFKKCDRIVTVRDSRFDQKAIEFLRHTDVTRRRIIKIWKAQFWYNSDKSLMLEDDQLQDLPEQLATAIKHSDRYLVRAYLTSKANEIVTTDNPLKNALTTNGIDCKHRCEFVPAYISQHGPK